MVTSQFADSEDMLENGETVKDFLERYFGFERSFLGVVAGMHVGFTLLFAFVFAFGIKSVNFQKR